MEIKSLYAKEIKMTAEDPEVIKIKEINLMVGDDSDFRRGKHLDIFSSIDFMPHYVYDSVSDITTITNSKDVLSRLMKVNKEDLLDYFAINSYLKSILFMRNFGGCRIENLSNEVLTRSKAKGQVSPDGYSTPVKASRDYSRVIDSVYNEHSDIYFNALFSSGMLLMPISNIIAEATMDIFRNMENLRDTDTEISKFCYEVDKYGCEKVNMVDRGSRVLNSLLPNDGNLVNFRNTFDIKFYNLSVSGGNDYITKKGAIVILREGFGSYLRSSKEIESIIEMYKAIYVAAINNYDVKTVTNSPFFSIMTKINSYKALANENVFTF